MGDILGAIFGTSSQTNQTTTPDVVSSALNMERYRQLLQLGATGGLWEYGQPGPANAYSPTPFSADIGNIARDDMLNAGPIDYSNLLSIDDYRRSFDPVTATYRDALDRTGRTSEAAQARTYYDYDVAEADLARARAGGLERSYFDYGVGATGAGTAYNTGKRDIGNAYNAAIARGDYDLARSLIISGNDAQQSLNKQDFNRARALELGIGATGNYVDMIARPRLEQALTLQGLERGGAVPEAIARATAEQAMPYLEGIESAYSTNQANTLNALMGLQTGASEAAAAGNRAAGSQLLASQTQLSSNYQNNITQLAQAMMANNVTLEQAGISAQSALGQQLMQAQNTIRQQQQQSETALASTYIPAASSFAQSMPQASTALSMAPLAMRAARTANLSALQPLADFPRQLNEADYLRRQGLFSTAYTGIPFTPGSTTFGGTSTGNIFDQLGGTLTSFGTNSIPRG